MGKTLSIIAREYVAIVRKKSFVIGLLVVPGIMIVALIMPILMMKLKVEKQLRLAVIDHTGQLHGALVAELDGTLTDGRPEYLIQTFTPAEGDTALQDSLLNVIGLGRLDALLVIPGGVYEGREVTFYGKSVGDVMEHRRLAGILTEAVVARQLDEQGLDSELVRKWTKRIELKTVKIEKGRQRKTGFVQEYLVVFILAMMLYFVLLIYGITVMRGVLEEKSTRLVELLLSSVRPEQLMAGKILGVGAAGLTQIAVWIGVGGAVSAYKAVATGSGLPVSLDAGTLVFFGVYFLLGYFLYATLYATIGSIYNSEQEAQNVQMIVVLPLVIPLLTITFVTRAPDAPLSVFLSLVPFFSPILMFARINVLTPPFYEIAASLLILTVSVVCMTWVAARIYRVGVLMQGKRATLPEILRWVRQK